MAVHIDFYELDKDYIYNMEMLEMARDLASEAVKKEKIIYSKTGSLKAEVKFYRTFMKFMSLDNKYYKSTLDYIKDLYERLVNNKHKAVTLQQMKNYDELITKTALIFDEFYVYVDTLRDFEKRGKESLEDFVISERTNEDINEIRVALTEIVKLRDNLLLAMDSYFGEVVTGLFDRIETTLEIKRNEDNEDSLPLC